jgi:hypothetical protein
MGTADGRLTGGEVKRGRPLSSDELAEFLARGNVARLACLTHEGWPYNVPVWYEWDGERFWIVGVPGAAWTNYLAADSRVSLCIDDPAPLRRMICQGHGEMVEGPTVNGRWVPHGRRMSARYLGAAAAAYDREMANFAGSLFAITPVRLITWQGPGRHRQR